MDVDCTVSMYLSMDTDFMHQLYMKLRVRCEARLPSCWPPLLTSTNYHWQHKCHVTCALIGMSCKLAARLAASMRWWMQSPMQKE